MSPSDDEKPKPQFGALKDLVLMMGDNFDDELEDFADYGPETLTQIPEPILPTVIEK